MTNHKIKTTGQQAPNILDIVTLMNLGIKSLLLNRPTVIQPALETRMFQQSDGLLINISLHNGFESCYAEQ